MAAEKPHVIAKRQYFPRDRGQQRLVVAIREVGTADRAVEQHIAEHRQAMRFAEEDHMPR
jgi:hypothetical protein